jgi:hypothetical protein
MSWEDLVELLKSQEGDHMKKKVEVNVGDDFFEVTLVQDLSTGVLTLIPDRAAPAAEEGE